MNEKAALRAFLDVTAVRRGIGCRVCLVGFQDRPGVQIWQVVVYWLNEQRVLSKARPLWHVAPVFPVTPSQLASFRSKVIRCFNAWQSALIETRGLVSDSIDCSIQSYLFINKLCLRPSLPSLRRGGLGRLERETHPHLTTPPLVFFFFSFLPHSTPFRSV